MAQAYFFNGQTLAISIKVNNGQTHQVPALNDQTTTLAVGLAANADIDVVGTGQPNSIVVTTTETSMSATWTVSMSGIAPNDDIQFLVFENQLLARQGVDTQGFNIVPAS